MKMLMTGGADFISPYLVDWLVSRSDKLAVLGSLDPQVHGRSANKPRHIAAQVTRLSHLGLGLQPQIHGKYRAGDVDYCVAETDEARRVLGFEARAWFEYGLRDPIVDAATSGPKTESTSAPRRID